MMPQIKIPWGSPKVRPILSETNSDDTVGSFGSEDVLLDKAKSGIPSWFRISSASYTPCEMALTAMSSISTDDAIEKLGSSKMGLETSEADIRFKRCGQNVLSSKKPPTWWQLALAALLDWFNGILVVIAIVNLAVPPPQFPTVGIIAAMIILGCIIRFWQEHRSAVAAIKLQDGLASSVRVQRRVMTGESIDMTVNQKDLVPGDVMYIDPGNTVPADCRLIRASNLSISQSR
jgi:Mg2+-importing ATPase